MFSWSSDDDLKCHSDFENSQNARLNFMEFSDNSYQYAVVLGSWAVSYDGTTISVSNGVITQRCFKCTNTDVLAEDSP